MVAEADTPAEAVIEAVTANNEAVVEQIAAVADKGASEAAKARKTRNKARKARRTATRARTVEAKTTGAEERTDEMNTENNIFSGFSAFPGAFAFDKLFADAAERSEETVKRSRKAAEELADMCRANLDAFVEAGRIAANGAQSIGQTIAAKGRDSVEQTANTVRSFAEAKSPTELLQLQSDFARSAFDRAVEDSSNLTESLVKLAGEAFQPLSNRASANVERFNEIVA